MIKLKQYSTAVATEGYALESHAVALESYMSALDHAQGQPELLGLMGISTEGYLGKLADAAKEAAAQWTVGFRRWKAGSWDKMSHEDKVRAIKKANFTFFYHNPKYIKNVKNVYDLAESVALNIIEGISEPNIETAEKRLVAEFETLLKAMDQRPTSKDIAELVGQFKSALKSYKPVEGSVGDDKCVTELVEFIDKAKFGVKYDIDELQHVLETAAKEATADNSPIFDIIKKIMIAFYLFYGFMLMCGLFLLLNKR